MPRRIDEDYKHFRDVIDGKLRTSLKDFFKGEFLKTRSKDGKISIKIPSIDIPRFVYGSNPNSGIARGEGKPGDVIYKDKGKGKKPGQPGNEHQEEIEVQISLEEILKFAQDELQLPNLKPKESDVYDEVRIKYNDLSLTGPESLRHNRKTMYQAMKRLAASNQLEQFHLLPGLREPVRLIMPIEQDKRYRQYKEIKVRSNNAVVFFARDGSGSMDKLKCDIVSDMSWWIDVWIQSFYDKTERVYFWHDTEVKEVSERLFYSKRDGGGTRCSSAFEAMAEKIKYFYPPEKWNIYIFYFSDGENYGSDNEKLVDIISKSLGPNVVNMLGITEIVPTKWDNSGSVKDAVDSYVASDPIKASNIRTTFIGNSDTDKSNTNSPSYYSDNIQNRDEQVLRAIKDLMGKQKST